MHRGQCSAWNASALPRMYEAALPLPRENERKRGRERGRGLTRTAHSCGLRVSLSSWAIVQVHLSWTLHLSSRALAHVHRRALIRASATNERARDFDESSLTRRKSEEASRTGRKTRPATLKYARRLIDSALAIRDPIIKYWMSEWKNALADFRAQPRPLRSSREKLIAKNR